MTVAAFPAVFDEPDLWSGLFFCARDKKSSLA